MQLDDPTGDRKAEPAASVVHRPGAVTSVEALEYSLGIRWRNPGSIVFYHEARATVSRARSENHLTAGGRVTNRVRDEIAEYLLKPLTVDVDDQL